MNTVMSENLEDLRDIRRQMDIYQPLGQEYLRQMSFYRNYEKAVERWAPENKLKHAGICILSMLITGPIGLGAAALRISWPLKGLGNFNYCFSGTSDSAFRTGEGQGNVGFLRRGFK